MTGAGGSVHTESDVGRNQEMSFERRIALAAAAGVAAIFTTSAAGNSNWRWLIAGAGIALLGSLMIWLGRDVRITLRRNVEELSRGTERILEVAGRVSEASRSLALGAGEQAASLEETSASSEKLSSRTCRNAENAQAVAEVTLESEKLVESANRTLAEMVTSMTEINEAGGRIARIIKVIDEIAFQTNILALNAAVEAAHAGEAGASFAVVAEEVRNLAQRSAQAAKDTATMIEESITKSNEGNRKLDQVKEAIAAITLSSAKIKTLVNQVSGGSQEQANGFAQVSSAIARMERIARETAAGAERSASAGKELNSQAAAMHCVLEPLVGLLNGRPPTPGPARPALAPVTDHKESTEARTVPRRKEKEDLFPMEDDFL